MKYYALASLLFAACGSDPKEAPAPPAPASNSTALTATPGEAPAAVPAAANAAPQFKAREGWIVDTPKSAMRQAQFSLPRVGDDAEDAELVVFHFQGDGGGVQANLERWYGQFTQPDGQATSAVAQTTRRNVGGFALTEVQLSGTYVAETTPGSGQRVNKPGFALLAAIVEGTGGPWYIKLVGPAKTLEHWRASWNEFLSGLAG